MAIDRERLADWFEAFLSKYDASEKDQTWIQQSQKFKLFWQATILSKHTRELNDAEIDEIVRILDKHGKGNTKDSEAVAGVMIPQGVWRRMFHEIHDEATLRETLTQILEDADSDRRISAVNRLYALNEGRKNSLTGQSGNAINALLAAYDPLENLSIVSLKDRLRLIEYFSFGKADQLGSLSWGEKIVRTNLLIREGFEALGIAPSARTLSVFCYDQSVRQLWREVTEPLENLEEKRESASRSITSEDYLFYMESQLEDFLIENWDRTELGQRYDLIKDEHDELVSQQYKTGIGKIDILAREKETGRYVVLELKKDQTSDDTIGQLARYMGWIEEHESNGKPTKGIIITARYDERLYYAAKKLKDVELYLYKVDFKLAPFER